MSTPTDPGDERLGILIRFLRCELCAIATYDLVLRRLAGDPTGMLERNRESHLVRVDVLREAIADLAPEPMGAPWPACLTAANDDALLDALIQAEDEDLMAYRDRDGIDEDTAVLVVNHLLPDQLATHERLRAALAHH